MRSITDIPQGTDIIALRKKVNPLIKRAQEEAKPDSCILCGKKTLSFCNSHSVPRMVLKSIAENGIVLHASAVIGIEYIDTQKGVNNSGTFHFICDDCDHTVFQDYEDPAKLLQKPTDKMLAEIALKNVLLQLSKRAIEKELTDILQEEYHIYENPKDLQTIKDIDIRDYEDDRKLLMNIILNNEQDVFHVLFWKKLPYKAPIALQTVLALEEDMNGNQINDVFDMREETRIENMHLCVFPIGEETIVLAFCHKRDKKYRGLKKQFVNTPDQKCLQYLNWLVFKYTENYFISKSIKKDVESNQKLRKLSQEANGFPNLGFVDTTTMLSGYDSVKQDEIPNFLDSIYAVSRKAEKASVMP